MRTITVAEPGNGGIPDLVISSVIKDGGVNIVATKNAGNGQPGRVQRLSGINTYTGATTVSAGILIAGSSQAFGVGSAVTVNSGVRGWTSMPSTKPLAPSPVAVSSTTVRRPRRCSPWVTPRPRRFWRGPRKHRQQAQLVARQSRRQHADPHRCEYLHRPDDGQCRHAATRRRHDSRSHPRHRQRHRFRHRRVGFESNERRDLLQ